MEIFGDEKFGNRYFEDEDDPQTPWYIGQPVFHCHTIRELFWDNK